MPNTLDDKKTRNNFFVYFTYTIVGTNIFIDQKFSRIIKPNRKKKSIEAHTSQANAVVHYTTHLDASSGKKHTRHQHANQQKWHPLQFIHTRAYETTHTSLQDKIYEIVWKALCIVLLEKSCTSKMLCIKSKRRTLDT